MQSTIDVSTAVCESAGIKRAASPCLSSSAEYHQPLPQHEFPCPTDQYKRQRTSDSIPSLKTPNTHATSARAPPSIVWRDFRNQEAKIAEEAQSPNHGALDPRDQMSNMIARAATPFTSTQHSKPGIEPRGPGEYFKPHGSLHNFFTKASIKTPRGVVDLDRVQVDERSPFNLVPWSIATNLDLMLYSGETLAITIAHHLIQTNHYSQFTIRVAGHNTTINTGVVSGLQTILLGREWIRSVHLLSDSGNQKYYIPIPLAIEVAEEKFPDIVDTEAEAKDVKPVDMATSNEIAEEHDDDKFRKADCGDDHSNCQSSQEDGSFSESEPSFDGQNLLDGDTPSDEPPSGDDTLSDGGTSSEGPISGKHEVTPIDEDDEDDSEDGESDDQDDHGDYQDGHGDDQDDGGEDDDGESDDGDGDDGEDDDGEDDDGEDDDGEDDNGEDDDGEDDDSKDDEDYKGREGKVCDECEGCEECDGFYECEGCEEYNEYNECEGCEECEGYEEYEEFGEGEEDPDDNLQDFMEQYTLLERFADAEQTKEAHHRQSESKGEIVSATTVFAPG
jgi:hypothetical protein